jgi:hypothetical protein
VNFLDRAAAWGSIAAMGNGSSEGGARGGGKPVRGAPPVRPPGTARSILRGEIENVGLPTLLTILDMERRSGLLLIQRQKVLGRLHVREGRVIRARIEGGRRGQGQREDRDQSTGAEAVFAMLGWPDGQFELWQAVVEGRDEVGESTTFLLMEGARRADEARGIVAAPSSMLGEAW